MRVTTFHVGRELRYFVNRYYASVAMLNTKLVRFRANRVALSATARFWKERERCVPFCDIVSITFIINDPSGFKLMCILREVKKGANATFCNLTSDATI